jgi:excisionase family DNA binding protein
MDTHKLLSKSEAARRVGVDRDTISRWIKLGYLHEVRIGPGTYPRIREADLDALVRGDHRPTTEPAS